MSHYLVTGAAGFIGARTSTMLIEQGHTVVGVDNLNDAYDVRMKEYRLKNLQMLKGFEFIRDDISQRVILDRLAGRRFDAVINLAAWAGVRASVMGPIRRIRLPKPPPAVNRSSPTRPAKRGRKRWRTPIIISTKLM